MLKPQIKAPGREREREVIVGMEMTARKEKILSSVVSGFVKTGEPVGSKSIAEQIGVSSATVRNEMAELIELGFLEQPHTSSGRIPSQKGYREYVNRLMKVPELSERERRYLDSMLLPGVYDTERLLRRTSQLLSEVTQYAAVVTTPSGASAKVRAVQFVQTSRRTAMIILMSSAGTMKSQIFHCDFDLSGEIMRVLFRVFNEKLAGMPVADITPAFLQTLGVSMGQMYVLATSAMQALMSTVRDTMETEIYLSGQMNLLFYPEMENGGARGVMNFLERKDSLRELLGQKPDRISVVIGRESGKPELEHASFVISRYRVSDEDAGAIAAAGPVRMDYPRLIALIGYLGKEVGKMLTLFMREE